jgi:hypothetical protein
MDAKAMICKSNRCMVAAVNFGQKQIVGSFHTESIAASSGDVLGCSACSQGGFRP